MFPVFLLRFHFVSNKKITSNIEITRTSGFNASVCAKTKSATAVQKGEPFFSKTETKEKRESRNAKDANNVFPGRRRRGMRVVPSTSPSWNDVDARFVAKFSPQPPPPPTCWKRPFLFCFLAAPKFYDFVFLRTSLIFFLVDLFYF